VRFKITPSITYFVMPMGLIGAGLNAKHLIGLLNLQYDFSIDLLAYGWLSFVLVMTHYVWNLISSKNRNVLTNEWYDPFRRSFLPAITLTTILFIMSLVQVIDFKGFPNQYYVLISLLIVTAFHLLLNVFLINGWLFDENLTLNQHKPTWYILLSGNFIIVIALNSEFVVLKNSMLYEFSMFFYAVGLFLWIVFSTTLFYRLIFNSQVQTNLRPSLFIFLAPSSLACVASMFLSESYINTGLINPQVIGIVTWMSFGFASTMLIAWLFSFKFFMGSGLSMAGWSFVYPLAAYGLALQYLSQALQNKILIGLSVVVFISLVVFIVLLSVWLIKVSIRSVNTQLID